MASWVPIIAAGSSIEVFRGLCGRGPCIILLGLNGNIFATVFKTKPSQRPPVTVAIQATTWGPRHKNIPQLVALMKIPGNQPIFYLWPIQKHLHLGIMKPIHISSHGGTQPYRPYICTSNLWGKCPLYSCNATGRLISWEIHYRPLQAEHWESLDVDMTRQKCY